MEHYISFENVVKRYQMGEVELTAVDGVDFSIEKGEFAIIVGPSGAGKTTVLHVLEELGAAVIDCDALYHKLLREDAALLGRIRDRFGPAVFDTEGNLDRKALGNVVFHDQEALSELNALTHAAVLAALDKLLAQAEGSGRKAAAVDAIALIESGAAEKCAVTVAVTAPAEARVKRLMAREGVSEDYARARIAAQKPDRFYEENCDFVVRNGGKPEECRARALALFEKIIDPKENS